jgi:four helix bundle protein
MSPYRKFRAWQACHKLTVELYRATRRYPPEERYGLVSQTRRAAFSAAANIAEGSARHGRTEFRHFLDIALGSLSEVAYALELARELKYLPDSEWGCLDELRQSASRLTYRLYRAMGPRPG